MNPEQGADPAPAYATGAGGEGSGEEASEVRVILVTGPDAEVLLDLGRRVVEERLAACVNVFSGVASVFRWEGEVQEEGEALAILKTTRERVEALQERVLALHPYDEPEFLALPVVMGSSSYARWVIGSVVEG